MQRASRTRLAVALSMAGLVVGTLGGNLVGAGADDPLPPVPGEAVVGSPSQVEADSAGGVSETPTTTTTTPAETSDEQAAPTTTTPAPASEAPASSTTQTPAQTQTTPSAQAPVPSAPAAPAAPATESKPAAPPAATATTPKKPTDEPAQLGGFAGVPQPDAEPCPPKATTKKTAKDDEKKAELVAGAKVAGSDAVDCDPPKPKGTTGRKNAGDPSDRNIDRPEPKPLRNAQGVPTVANPTTSIAALGPAPIGVPNFFIDKFRIPVFLLPIYQAAGIEYGVRWEVLAAINEIETDYGRNLNVSSAGALGWMQFMPATWEAYGVDANRDGRKDPFNPVDAIFAAARYLKAAGADEDLRKAIFAYNHADWYVESVLMRARLIGGLPTDLVGSLSGLTQGRFPVYAKARYADDLAERKATRRVAIGQNAAMPVESDAARNGIDIFAEAGAPVTAVQDGKIIAVGRNERLGNFVRLTDPYGNTYTYGHLKKIAQKVAVPKIRTQSKASIAKELELPKADPKPTRAATAGKPTHKLARQKEVVPRTSHEVTPPAVKERLFAHPARKNALPHGGAEQLLELGSKLGNGESLDSYFTGDFGLDKRDVVLKPLVAGTRVIAGTILGRIGKTSDTVAPHMHFEIKPAGRGAPRIDPKPILDGWKLLEATAIYRAKGTNPLHGAAARTASIGQIMLMSKEMLARRVLANPRIEVYSCGRRDIEAGSIDRRVLATLEFLAASGLKPTVTSLFCGHSYLTASGNVSAHSAGAAVDIAKINGIPILGHQGEGSITDITIRRLLTLQGTVKPNQIISLMTYEGADNTLALGDHADHIHVGFRPELAAGSSAAKQIEAVLKPSQWVKLIDRLGQIDNPVVSTKPSKYAIKVPVPRASVAHDGE
jgi:hypothetical protein